MPADTPARPAPAPHLPTTPAAAPHRPAVDTGPTPDVARAAHIGGGVVADLVAVR
jgi:hypothetical protein